MTNPLEEMRFLGRLVQRGILDKEQAEQALKAAAGGSALKQVVELGLLSAERLDFLQRMQGEDVPQLPGYEIVGLAGKGGTAVVVHAREIKTGKDVALKVLFAELDDLPEARIAFLKEARLLCDLDHENLVKGHRAGTYRGRHIFLLEWVEGASLLGLLRDGHEFAEEEALFIILQAARGLRYLSEQGVVHRDIKPDNILITRQNQVKIIDLGYAATGAGADGDTTVGTVAYISPEQARGQGDLDVRADIYSLGATLYQLVVGELPFEGDDREMLASQILDSLSSEKLKSRRISPHLHYFLEKMMAKEREVRYQSPSELIEDIEEQIRGRKSATFGASTDEDQLLSRPFDGSPAPTSSPKKFPDLKRRRRR